MGIHPLEGKPTTSRIEDLRRNLDLGPVRSECRGSDPHGIASVGGHGEAFDSGEWPTLSVTEPYTNVGGPTASIQRGGCAANA